MNEFFSLISGGIAGAVVTWLAREWISTRLKEAIGHEYDAKLESLKDELKNKQRIDEHRWMLKYKACMQALDLADAALSNMDISGIEPDMMVRESIKTVDVRDCVNGLACSCDNGNVLKIFKKIVLANSSNPVTMDIVVDLRNSVREELGFSTTAIDDDRIHSFIGRVEPYDQTGSE